MDIDLLIQNVNIFNVYFKKFIQADVAILDGKFLYVGSQETSKFRPKHFLDGKAKYLIPGLIDIHMHIESSMATPRPFSYELIKNGVTTIVAEPHEIANVFGIEGIKTFLSLSKGCNVDIFLGVPSSVPSTSLQLETPGSEINLAELEDLLKMPRVICLGEVMNYVDVIYKPHSKINQFIEFVKTVYPYLRMEGHCPKLLGLELARFIYAGVDSDHTQQTLAGLKERLSNGMFVEIQEKSLTRDIINFLVENKVYEHFAFVTDDVMADTLVHEGHLNKIVKKAINLGMTPEQAIYAATYTSAQRMGLHDRGSIAPGKKADFLLLDNLHEFIIANTYKDGKEVYDKKTIAPYTAQQGLFPKHFYTSVKLAPTKEADFQLTVNTDKSTVQCRMIKVSANTTFTEEVFATLPVQDGCIDWENSPYCLAAVFERHGKNGNIGLGLVTGDIIQSGAIASTYAHDHHNLLVMGKTKRDMAAAANAVIASQGGYCVVKDKKIIANLDLPVAGILSETSMDEIGQNLQAVKTAMQSLGYRHNNPIMSFSTLSLPVSQELKITDIGLIRVNEQKQVDIIAES